MSSITTSIPASSIQSDIIQPYIAEYNVTTAWPNPARYKQHRHRKYTPPAVAGKRPPLLALALHRLDHLIANRHGHLPWTLGGIKIKSDPEAQKHRGASPLRVRLGVIQLHHHDKTTPSGAQRRRRDQAVQSADIVLRYLLGRCNVQRGQRLEWLECARTSHDRLAEQTGLSRSAVRDALTLLYKTGFVRHQRIRANTAKGVRERPARRWLTPHLFAALGLARPYLRQLSGGRQAQRAQQATSTRPAQATEQKPTAPTDEQRATALSHVSRLRNLIKGRPPSPD